MKLKNPYYDKDDPYDEGIMKPVYNHYPLEWILKRIQHNAKAQKLPVDMKKVERYANKFPSYKKQEALYEISYQVYLGELRGIFKRDKITPKKLYTKEEAAVYLGLSVKSIDSFHDTEKLRWAEETRGNKILIWGRDILGLEKIRK